MPHKLQTAGQRSPRCGRSCLSPLAQDEGRAWSSCAADPHLRLPGGGGPGCPGPLSERMQTAREPLQGCEDPDNLAGEASTVPGTAIFRK